MSGEEGHSDCKCSQNIDFFEQILNRKNPLEEWFKNQVEKMLPEDLRNFARSLEIIEDTKNNKTTYTQNFHNFDQKLNVKGDNNRNENFDKDYTHVAESNNAIRQFRTKGHNKLDVRSDGDINRNYSTPGECTLNVGCAKYNSALTVGDKKYVMKHITLDDLFKNELYVYVLDNNHNNGGPAGSIVPAVQGPQAAQIVQGPQAAQTVSAVIGAQTVSAVIGAQSAQTVSAVIGAQSAQTVSGAQSAQTVSGAQTVSAVIGAQSAQTVSAVIGAQSAQTVQTIKDKNLWAGIIHGIKGPQSNNLLDV